jgi:hypothetical protein
MKTHLPITSWIAIFLLVVASFTLSGCKEDPARSTLRLSLQNYSTMDTKSLVPTGIPLDVTNYRVEGTGPQGSRFTLESTKASLEIEGLLIGNWSLYAVGQNSSGIDLVEGSTSFQLTTEPSNVTVQLNTLKGTGTMTINFQWDTEKISNASIELSVTNQLGEKTPVSATTNNIANGSVTYSAFYPAGSYTVQARLFSGNIAVAGCAEAVRVVGNKITEGTITLDLDKVAEIPSSLTLVNKAGIPIACSISGLSASMVALQDATAEITTTNLADTSELDTTWFLDGVQIGKGLTCTFAPSSGSHRLDVIATGALLASSGSASFTFQAAVGGVADLPVLMTEIADGYEGLSTTGNTKVAFLPDGKVLLAGTTHNTLQVCRIVRDTLEVLHTYSVADAFNTSQITDILVDPTSYRVAIADAATPGIGLYQYDGEDASLTKLFYRDNVKYVQTNGSTLTFSDINMLALDGNSKILYCTVPGSSDLPMSRMDASSSEDFNTNTFTYFFLSQLQEISGMAISPGNNKAALYSEPDGLLKLCTRDSLDVLIANDSDFSLEENGTPYLNGISSVGFLDDSNAVCGTGNALSRFHYTSAQDWEQAETWLSGQDGIDSMLGIKQVFTNSLGTVLYAICKDSKNINCFSIDSSTGVLSYLGEADLGTFYPTEAAISPDREFMVVVSDSSNKVLLCRIPQ